MAPGGIIVAAEVVGFSVDDLTRRHVMDLIGQRENETADAGDPRNERLVRPKALADVKIAAVAVVEVKLL